MFEEGEWEKTRVVRSDKKEEGDGRRNSEQGGEREDVEGGRQLRKSG